jgi:hypothetical protein
MPPPFHLKSLFYAASILICSLFMDQQLYKGKISFINYEKQFATIEYLINNKQKAVNCKTNETDHGKKLQQFRLGDVVTFLLKLSARGDKMTAINVKVIHNTAIHLLIQKAAIENRFSGYLKIIGDKYFVKEWESYILFPLLLSPWEKPPVETAANGAISFKFVNHDNPNQIAAELFSHNYIPEYRMALQYFKNEIDAEAIVYKISPHAVYVQLFNNKIQTKLPVTEEVKQKLREGDTLRVLITHLTNTRIVVKQAANKS